MRRHLKTFVCVVFMTGLLSSSCSKNSGGSSGQSQTSFSQGTAQQLASQAKQLQAQGKTAEAKSKAQEAADYYARIGELLLMPEGFKYADDMFAKALEIDPSNRKANFYKSVTEPSLQLQGFIPRFEKLASMSDQVARLEALRTSIAKLNMPEVAAFANNMPSGGAPFQTNYDVQRFARESILPSLQASLDKLSKIDISTPLQLNFTPSRAMIDPVNETQYYSYSSCVSDPTTGWNCTNTVSQGDSGQSDRNLFFVDQYDMKALQSMLRATIDQVRLGTAYSLKGEEAAMQKIADISQNGNLTDRDVAKVLRSFPQLLTLESDQQLAPISQSTAQALKDGLELASLSDQLCNNSNRGPLSSIIYPICITAEAATSYQLGLDLLAGPKQIGIGHDEDGNSVNIEIDVTVLMKNPQKDLKALLPTSFDEDGNAVNYPDKTMGGLFPNGDIIDKVKQVADEKPQNRLGDALQGYLQNVEQWLGISNDTTYSYSNSESVSSSSSGSESGN